MGRPRGVARSRRGDREDRGGLLHEGEEVAVRTIKPLAAEAGTVARVIWLKKGHFAANKGEQTSDPAASAAEDE